MKSFLRNDRGMSMVEVLMALGFTGILAAVLVNLSEQQNKQHKKALVDSETIEVYSQFNRVISRADSCGATFVGMQVGDAVNEFRYDFNENAEAFATVRMPFRGTKLILASMELLKDQDGDDIYDTFPLTSQLTDQDGDGIYETPLTLKSQNFVKTQPEIRKQDGIVVLEVVLQRPGTSQGAKTITKFFEVPAVIGEGKIDHGPVAQAVIDNCKGTPVDTDKCIASFDNFECAPSGSEASYLIQSHDGLMGYCFDKSPSSPQDSYILHCTTAK